jgi:hypothetical protein
MIGINSHNVECMHVAALYVMIENISVWKMWNVNYIDVVNGMFGKIQSNRLKK